MKEDKNLGIMRERTRRFLYRNFMEFSGRHQDQVQYLNLIAFRNLFKSRNSNIQAS
jgi:hypothetical protein